MRSRKTLFVLFFIFVLAPASVYAQFSQTGTVTGVVRNTSGVPVAGVRVMATPAANLDERGLVMSNFAIADDSGRYRLENVPAGRYLIAAGRVDVPTFYPDTLEKNKATAVSISSGTPVSGIDITLQDASGGASATRQRNRASLLPQNIPFPVPPIPAIPPMPQVAPFTLGPDFPLNLQNLVPSLNGLAVTMDRLVRTNSGAAWWTNTALVRRLGITDEQKRKIEAVFEQRRPMLVQTKAELEKEEAALARMLEADPMESTKVISAQIDRVILARGDMERTNSQMTLEMRQILTSAQWMQLQMELPQGATGLVTVPTPAPLRRVPQPQQQRVPRAR